MAKAKKCDRCGKYYDENARFPVDQTDHYYISGVMTVTTGDYPCKNYDLCDDCIDAFRVFIKDENLTDTNL